MNEREEAIHKEDEFTEEIPISIDGHGVFIDETFLIFAESRRGHIGSRFVLIIDSREKVQYRGVARQKLNPNKPGARIMRFNPSQNEYLTIGSPVKYSLSKSGQSQIEKCLKVNTSSPIEFKYVPRGTRIPIS